MDLNQAQFAAHTARIKSVPEDVSIRHPYYSDHDWHGPNPVFKHAGWGADQPCGYLGCKHHDEQFSERLDDAQMSKLHQTVDLKPEQHGLLRPLEGAVDIKTVQKYAQSAPDRPAIVAELPGYPGLHVLDGHHRLLAGAMAGRSVRAHVKSG